MRKKQKILFMMLICFSIVLHAYTQNETDWSKFYSICFDSLDANSKQIKIPQILTKFENDRIICDTVLEMIFKGDYDARYEHSYYYQYKIVDSTSTYFIITKEERPIVMMYNILLYQVVFNSKNELLGVRDLGCLSCNNDYPETDESFNIESILFIDYNKIKRISTETDGIYFGESDSTNTTITVDTLIYNNNRISSWEWW